MIRPALAILALLAATASVAAEEVVLRIQNQSSQPVIGFNAYPVIAGTLSPTTIGTLAQGIEAGGHVNLTLTAPCGVVHIYVRMFDQSQTDATLNTCARRDVVITN
ncbi:hypothetical protein [Devosia sp.]|uniref:hypothetical protein n=1 Tax=Devosia sp. TaxID=1871048 RepID=UPI0032638348